MLIDASAFMGSHVYTVACWLTGPRAPRTTDCGLLHTRFLQALERRPLPAWVSPAWVYRLLLSAWHGRMCFATAMVLSQLRSLDRRSAPLFWAANACPVGNHACLAAPAPCTQYGAYREARPRGRANSCSCSSSQFRTAAPCSASLS